MNHLILALEAPLMAFGGETVDNLGVVRWFPAASMLTGLLANAIGWRRTETQQHQRLQDRLIFAARIDREPAGSVRLTDFQTAAISKKDSGWTTRGAAEGREGGSYTNTLRYRDYLADMRVTVALRLHPAEIEPTSERLADALDHPLPPAVHRTETVPALSPPFPGISRRKHRPRRPPGRAPVQKEPTDANHSRAVARRRRRAKHPSQPHLHADRPAQLDIRPARRRPQSVRIRHSRRPFPAERQWRFATGGGTT